MQLIVDGLLICQINGFEYLPFAGQLLVQCADLIFAGGFE